MIEFNYIVAFLFGVGFAALIFWLWEMITRGGHRAFVRYLDNRVAPEKVEAIVEDVRQGRLRDLSREEIWERMSWIWKEARQFAFASNRLFAIPSLGLFLILFLVLWFKTLLFPNPNDIRVLLAAETFLMSVVNRNEE